MTHDPAPAQPAVVGAPRVSVVLICFNDAQRLPEAIESARAQSLAEIEIIVVDHGSTDGSVEVAAAAAAQDPRIRVIDLGDNEGKPGRPINAGIAAATAPWVTVFASDDILRPRACENMLRAAEEVSADIVVGSLQRVDMDTGETSRWMPGVTLRTRVITSIDQLPDLIRDTTGGGKLYSTDFIRTHGLSFPEDIFYQDQVFTLEYYANAATVAILSNFVLDWRHWPSGRQSVTQRRTTTENLSDRFTANERIDRFLRAEGREDLLILKQRKFLQHDLAIHVKDLAGTTPEYRAMLVERTTDYVAGFQPEAFVGLPLNKLFMLRCLQAGRLEDAESVTTVPYNRITATWPRLTEQGRIYVSPPWLPRAADPVFDVTDYRLAEIPTRFRSVRVQVRSTVERAAVTFHLTLAGPGRVGPQGPRTVDLVLADTLNGNSTRVRLKERGQEWVGSVSVADLDASFGGAPVTVEQMALFDDGLPGRWSAQVHVDPEQPTHQESGPWSVNVTDDTTLLERGHGEVVARRFESLRRDRPILSIPDGGELLSLSEARQFLRDTDIEPLPDRMFFESFAGRRIADGPLVVSRRLQERRRRRKVRQSWSCTPWAQLDVPTYAQAAPRFSRAYMTALAESSVWFDNGWLPFRPRDGRRLVQLWHGTPIARLPVEAERQPPWHSVASSGPYFEACLQEAWPQKEFRFIPSGAPRTDPLLGASAQRRRTELREAWGLTDRTVIYFSPTLREGDVDVGYRQPDLHRMAESLGQPYFWIHREHDDDATGRRMSGIPDDLRWFAATVSGRVEISDYLLMADLLVTDYASVATDFALTRRPIIHYVTDRDWFESHRPGTYFGLAARSAGPVVGDDGDLIDAIKNAGVAGMSPEGDDALVAHLAPWDARASADALLDWLEL